MKFFMQCNFNFGFLYNVFKLIIASKITQFEQFQFVRKIRSISKLFR